MLWVREGVGASRSLGSCAGTAHFALLVASSVLLADCWVGCVGEGVFASLGIWAGVAQGVSTVTGVVVGVVSCTRGCWASVDLLGVAGVGFWLGFVVWVVNLLVVVRRFRLG